MNRSFALAGLAAVALTFSACTTPADRPEGTYKHTESTVDSNGTKVEKQTSTQVERDDNGDKKTVVKTKTTRDPKGLMNKETTSESKEVYEEDK